MLLSEPTHQGSVPERLSEAHRSLRSLTFFFTEETDPVLAALGRLLAAFASEAAADPEQAVAAYRQFLRLLADAAEFHAGEFVGDAWRDYLLERLLADENTFARKAALSQDGSVSPALRAAAIQDLRHLQVLFALESSLFVVALARRTRRAVPGKEEACLVAWEDLRPLADAPSCHTPAEARLMAAFAAAADWGELVDELARHYAQAGCGLFHRYRAFRWVSDPDGGHLEGVAHPDPVSLDDLIGYEAERRILLRNTEHFLAGFPANNVLLYGDRGTGKSSTVKALLNAYADRGLRLVEVQKHQFDAFPRLLALLRGRRERFILYVDDLSFEQNETYYKELKAVLEGGLEARPENVVLYATSNRRHLITERFADRDGSNGEIHARDAAQEKLSLSDRFGITVTFLSPDQEGYLSIVAGLADRLGLQWPREVLRQRALQRAGRQNGWSGRTARQFLEFALGEEAAERRSGGA